MNTMLIQQMLSGIVVVVSLAVGIAMIACLLLIIGLYAGYLALVENGLNSSAALLVVGLLMAAIICMLVLLIQNHVRTLKSLPGALIQSEAPLTSGVTNVANAFVDGLRGTKKQKENIRR